ncbi:MAG: hypothetical protein MJ137_08205 [Clostridia bacterium]|nr:hypothetical protein [Clostridia bacterium]
MKKILVYLLLLATLLTVCSCAGPADIGNENTTSTSVSSAVDSETEENIPQNLIDCIGNQNFGGDTVNILIRKSCAKEMFSEGVMGEMVSDAVYNRNLAVEERLGIKLNVIPVPGEWAERDSFIATVENSAGAGDYAYDIIMTHNTYIASLGMKGLSYNLYDLPTVDLSKKWWNKAFTDDMAINGKSYYAIGDLAYSIYAYIFVTYFNKSVTADKNTPDLYDLVDKGEWTFEKMKEIALTAGSDTDGNGIWDNKDEYGLSFGNFACRYSVVGFDVPLAELNGDGKYEIIKNNEKYLNLYSELYDLLYNNNQVWYESGLAPNALQMFADGRVMLHVATLGNAEALKDMSNEYGIIPFPKYNSDQPDYITPMCGGFLATTVAADIRNPQTVGAALEALCMYGYKMITPAYYETTIKYRYLSDSRAMGLLDGIRDRVASSFVVNYSDQIDHIVNFYGDNIQSKTMSITAAVRAKQKTWQKAIDDIYASAESSGNLSGN